MKLVVQVRTEDKLKAVKKWVTDAFSIIPNKKLGPQNYRNLDRNGKRSTPICGTLPYKGNENEMPVIKSSADSNGLYIFWNLPVEE